MFYKLCNFFGVSVKINAMIVNIGHGEVTTKFEDTCMYSSMPASKNCHKEFVHVDKG